MSNTDLVRRFIGAWEARSVEDILTMMTPMAVYKNSGLPDCVGHRRRMLYSLSCNSFIYYALRSSKQRCRRARRSYHVGLQQMSRPAHFWVIGYSNLEF